MPSGYESHRMQIEAHKALTGILEQTGHSLALDDFDLISELDAAAQAVSKGSASDPVCLFAYPYYAANCRFNAPTIGKELYWRECVAPAVSDEWQGIAFLWLLSADGIPTERGDDIAAAVKKYGRACPLTGPDAERVLAHFSVHEDEGGTARFGEVLALLVREYGKDIDHWLRAPEQEVQMLVADWTARQEAQAAAVRKAQSGRGAPTPPPPTAQIKSLAKFALIRERIREQWQKSA